MKLLAKEELKTLSQTKIDHEVRSSNRLAMELTDQQKKLNILRELYKEEKEKFIADRDMWSREMYEFKKTIFNEVSALEQRKKTALEPLDDLKNRLNIREQELNIRELEIIEKEEIVQKKLENIESENKKLDKKRLEIEQKNFDLENKKEENRLIGADVELKKKELSIELENYNKLFQTKKKELEEKEQDALLAASKRHAERVILDERIKELEKIREEVNQKLARVKYVKS